MVCLDTDFLVGVLRGDENARALLKEFEAGETPLSTTAITVYELLKGARRSLKAEENWASVEALVGRINILATAAEEAAIAASIYDALKRSGELIGELDILIAASARSNNETLVTRDRDFESVKQLKVRRW